jgi:serine protease Do
MPDGQRYTGTLVGSDAYSNVALFRLSVGTHQPPVQGTADDLMDGDLVHSVVATTDGKRQTVTARVLKARRLLSPQGQPSLPYIEIEDNDPATPIRGPIFDNRGKLVGLITLRTDPEHKAHTALAIPIGDVTRMARDLKLMGRVSRSRLGLTLRTVSDDLAAERGLAQPMGALVVETSQGSPAARVGLATGDIILKVNTDRISTPIRAPDDYTIAMERIRAGTLVQLDVLGITGRQRRVYVTTGELIPALNKPPANNKQLP